MFSRFFFIIFSVGFAVLANAQRSKQIKWNQFISSNTKKTQTNDNQTNNYLVKFKNRKALQKNKKLRTRILRILDEEYAIISFSKKEYLQAESSDTETWEANNLWKYSPNLLNKHIDIRDYFIVKTNSPTQLKKLIKEKTTLKIINTKASVFFLEGSFTEIEAQLSLLNYIYYIGLESLKPKQETKIAELDLSENAINKIHHLYPSLDGAGEVISIKDNLFDDNDLDLTGKYIISATASSTIDPHATAMATISSGAGNTSIKGKGVACKSKVTSSNFESLLPDQIAQLTELGVSVQNHSYGTEIENFYGALAEAYDNFCFTNPEFIHIFSSGNSGELVPQDGIYQNIKDFANITGNYKMAKNTLCIGAKDFLDQTADFSSKGPAYDGRIKPELVAYSFVGTSNSTALTSGLCLLLQQQYQNKFGNKPPSALIKACLINSADDIDNPGPDFTSGYGNINAYNALMSINNNQFFIDELVQDETKKYILKVPTDASNLKVTLVWTDPPAQVNSNIALVNDLDLKIVAPNASNWLPWTLDSSPDAGKLNLTATRKADHLNTVEQITIENLEEGYYTIEINGLDISTPVQKFSLVYDWSKKNTFEWSYPTGSDAIALRESPFVKLKWQSTYNIQKGELSVNYNDGSDWQAIDNQVQLANKQFLWNPKPGTNSTAVLRMRIDGIEYLSDTFAISDETNTNVALDCDKTLELTWNRSSNAVFYNIYNYQNGQMEKIASVEDTSYAFEKSQFASSYFAIEPVFTNNLTGLRSETIDYLNFGAECYFDSFYAFTKNENDEHGIEIFMEIGSNYQLDKLELYRVLSNKSELINTYQSLNKLSLNYFDTDPIQGLNQYQLKITLSDGKEYQSEIINAYFLSEKSFLIFPNPTTTKSINVFSKDFGENKVVFRLFNTSGQKVLDYLLQSDREFIEFNTLKCGTYIYRLESSNGIRESSILIIN